MPSTVRISVGLIGLVVAGLVLRFSIHTAVAAWLVFPAPVLNPGPPEVDTAGVLVERALGHASGEAHYWFMSGKLHQQWMRAQWFSAEAPSQGQQAVTAANKAIELLAENPYYHRLAGSIAIDMGRHPAVAEVEAGQFGRSAVSHMQNALRLGPSSPLLHQQVGLELLKIWPILDPAGQDLARQALHRAATWEPDRLRTSLVAIWARDPSIDTLDILETATPDTPAARGELGRFLAVEADRFASSNNQLSWDLGSRALRAHRRAMELSHLDLAYVERWIVAHEHLRPEHPDLLLAAGLELTEHQTDRPEAHLVLGRALAASGRTEEARGAASRAVSLAAAPLREHVDQPGAEGFRDWEQGVARLRWELGQGRDSNQPAERLRYQIEVYSQALRFEADLLFDNESFELALERYRRLSTLAGGDPYPSMQMGRALDALGESDEALDMYRTAVRVAPRSASARSALARAYLERHEYLAAIREWRAVASRNRRALAPRLAIARAYREMGLLEEAVRAYSDALESAPGNAAVQREMEAVVERLQGSQVRRD